MSAHKRLFTLLELLAVICVILVLLSMMMPVMSSYQEKARRLVCLSSMKQIGIGLMGYAASNRNRVPTRDSDSSQYPGMLSQDNTDSGAFGRTFNQVLPGIFDYDTGKGTELFTCSSQRFSARQMWLNNSSRWRCIGFFYWSIVRDVTWSFPLGKSNFNSGRISDVDSKTPLLSDPIAYDGQILFNANHVKNGYSGNGYVPIGLGFGGNGGNYNTSGTPTGINQLHADGSGRWYGSEKFKKVYKTYWGWDMYAGHE